MNRKGHWFLLPPQEVLGTASVPQLALAQPPEPGPLLPPPAEHGSPSYWGGLTILRLGQGTTSSSFTYVVPSAHSADVRTLFRVTPKLALKNGHVPFLAGDQPAIRDCAERMHRMPHVTF